MSLGACSLRTESSSRNSSKVILPLPSLENTEKMRFLKGFSWQGERAPLIIHNILELKSFGTYPELGQGLHQMKRHFDGVRFISGHAFGHSDGAHLAKALMYPIGKSARIKISLSAMATHTHCIWCSEQTRKSYDLSHTYLRISFLVKKVQSWWQ